MRGFLSGKLGTAFFAVALIVLVLSCAPQTHAQTQPCLATCAGNDPITCGAAAQINMAVWELQQQGAEVYCDDTNMYVHFPDGTFFNITVPPGGAMSLFSFNPVTGQVTYWYVLDGDPPRVIIQDSTYGLINATDGWFGMFYPIGNPFSAAIQNPMQALMMGFHSMPPDPWGIDPTPSPRPAPIMECCD